MGVGNMTNSIKPGFKTVVFIALLILIAGFGSYCEKKETKTDHEIIPGETAEPPKVDFKALEIRIDSLQTLIQQNPTVVTLRQQLLMAAVDTAAQLIRTVGRGLPPADARNPVIGRQAAERAARIDAARWAAYINTWRQDVTTADFGMLTAMVPGGRILESHETETGEIVLLVETLFPVLP